MLSKHLVQITSDPLNDVVDCTSDTLYVECNDIMSSSTSFTTVRGILTLGERMTQCFDVYAGDFVTGKLFQLLWWLCYKICELIEKNLILFNIHYTTIKDNQELG